MNQAPPLITHEAFPNEILAMIFEEHAILEWWAPAIDGRVCRLWRQIVLNTPRAWSYLDVSCYERKQPGIGELCLWLHRSGAASLHVSVNRDFILDGCINGRTLYDVLGGCHARIASLQMTWGNTLFFEGRDFPCLNLLVVKNWAQAHFSSSLDRWGPMPELRSLRLGHIPSSMVPLNTLASLGVLVLHDTTLTSLP